MQGGGSGRLGWRMGGGGDVVGGEKEEWGREER
jgi:hypothetical protein